MLSDKSVTQIHDSNPNTKLFFSKTMNNEHNNAIQQYIPDIKYIIEPEIYYVSTETHHHRQNEFTVIRRNS
jgi:hypothetical protein